MRQQNTSAGAPYIAFANVEVAYSDFVQGLRGVTLNIDKGEFVFLCGRTGSGKSTVLKCLSREVWHTSGSVCLEGRELTHLPVKDVAHLRRQMGIVPQDFGLLPNKRVWENLGYAMRACGRTRREVRKLVPDILERVNMLQRADAFPRELSGGEQQRVAIGRALINNPPLLLADEPTGNLDPQHSVEVIELLQQLNLRGTTVVVATHDMPIVEKFGHRVVLLDEGRIVTNTLDLPDGQPSLDGETLSSKYKPQTNGQDALGLFGPIPAGGSSDA
jgi:cell division transport system ATP-binding protein